MSSLPNSNALSSGPLKILMIEDDAELGQGWSDVFELLGHDFRCHARAAQALSDEIGIEQANLIISDFYLPDMNGADLLRRIRELNPKVPVVLLTGSREAGVAESVASLEGCTLMYKPVNIEAIERHIASLRAA